MSAALVLDDVSFRQHALMKDTGNQNAIGFLPVEDDVFALYHATQA
jgi:hypothetical protein